MKFLVFLKNDQWQEIAENQVAPGLVGKQPLPLIQTPDTWKVTGGDQSESTAAFCIIQKEKRAIDQLYA